MKALRHLWPRIERALVSTMGLLAGCGHQTGPAEEPVRVSAISVESPLPGAPEVIRYRVENLSTRRVFVLACGDRLVAELEQRATTKWVPADAAVRCLANLPYLPIAVEARSIGDGTITAPRAGIYRLRLEYQVDRPSGRKESVVSGPIPVPQP